MVRPYVEDTTHSAAGNSRVTVTPARKPEPYWLSSTVLGAAAQAARQFPINYPSLLGVTLAIDIVQVNSILTLFKGTL